MQDNQQPSLRFKPLEEDPDYLIYENGTLFSKKTDRFLKGKIDNVGYVTYALNFKNNTKKSRVSDKKLSTMAYAHRLVAQYFIPNEKGLPVVHHKDGNKLNNHYLNLEWVSSKENSARYLANNKREISYPEYYQESLDGEKWVELWIDDLYMISSLGRIMNKKSKRIIKLDNSQKYTRVCLRNKKHYYLHRLVYCSFADDCNLEGYVIDHIDNNSKNNAFTNLQKITQSENCLKQERFNDYRKFKISL